MKNQKGITLVALVVTIVVLLILAGITIAYVLQGDSIFGAAREADTKTETGEVQQAVSIGLLSVQTEYYTKMGNFATISDTNTNEKAASDTLRSELTKVGITAPTANLFGTIETVADGKVTGVKFVSDPEAGFNVTYNNKTYNVKFNSNPTNTSDKKIDVTEVK